LNNDKRDYAYYAWLGKFLAETGILPAALDNYPYMSVRCIQD